jgi:hypothetical protein
VHRRDDCQHAFARAAPAREQRRDQQPSRHSAEPSQRANYIYMYICRGEIR